MTLSIDLSLIIPSFNRADLISQTLDSALNQTQPFKEIIVADDGSTDNTLEVLKKFGDRIKVLPLPKAGVQAARNQGASAATSSYVTFCDSDDLLEPTFVAVMSAWLLRHPECDSVYSNFTQFTGTEVTADKFSQAPPGYFSGAIKEGDFFRNIPELYAKTIVFQPLFVSGVVIKKTFFQELGGFDPVMNHVASEDWEYTLRAVGYGDVALCCLPLVRVRRHDGNDSRNSVRQALGEVIVLEHALAHHSVAAPFSKLIRNSIDQRQLAVFEKGFGMKDFKTAAAVYPLLVQKPTTLKFRIKAAITVLWAVANNRDKLVR